MDNNELSLLNIELLMKLLIVIHVVTIIDEILIHV